MTEAPHPYEDEIELMEIFMVIWKWIGIIMTEAPHPYEDEIELMEIFMVIWKWKYIIMSGTLFCALAAAIISFNMAKIYCVDMVLQPGILSVGEAGKNVYIDSANNIKALIEAGTFNGDILRSLNNADSDNAPTNLNFKVTIPKSSDIIKIEYETANIKQGITIEDHLNKLLMGRYGKLVQHFQNEYKIKSDLKKSEISKLKAVKQSTARNIKDIEKRIDGLISKIELVRNNTNHLIKEQNDFVSKNTDKSNILPALLYSNTIQQNLGHSAEFGTCKYL
ncbi:MAG: hypothetical protein JRI28_07590 [Deltaproteobacteria bacterium]|nr:hypothetical protein [Deltaproteobacteria bacterium]